MSPWNFTGFWDVGFLQQDICKAYVRDTPSDEAYGRTGMDALPLEVHTCLLQDALPVVMATAREVSMCCTSKSGSFPQQPELQDCEQLQDDPRMERYLELETISKLLYLRACGHLAAWIVRHVSLDALLHSSAAAGLVSPLRSALPIWLHC
jgi:hypothetical protein